MRRSGVLSCLVHGDERTWHVRVCVCVCVCVCVSPGACAAWFCDWFVFVGRASRLACQRKRIKRGTRSDLDVDGNV